MEGVREAGLGPVVCASSFESDHGQFGVAEEQDPQKQCRKNLQKVARQTLIS